MEVFLVEIIQLIQERTGIDVNTLGTKTLLNVIHQRLEDCGLENKEIYLTKLKDDPTEFNQLVDHIVVSETWFFRDREAYRFLENYVKYEWQPVYPQGILRILTVPCATGEEPYSIAISLQQAGLSPQQFTIDALDISPQAIAKAKLGIYNENSFRGSYCGNPKEFKHQYFNRIVDHRGSKFYEILPKFKSNIRFACGNILDSNLLGTPQSYHVIFCRNLLIYLETSARCKVLVLLENILKENGLLFVGYSETSLIRTERLISIQKPLTFAFRKGRKTPLKTPPTLGESSTKTAKTLPVVSRPPVPHKRAEKPEEKHQYLDFVKAPRVNSPEIFSLAGLQELANQGNLTIAAQGCETYLKDHPQNAEAHILMGVILQAQGQEVKALDYFNRAVYLAPNSYDALLHLALLKESLGDALGAQLLWQRIQRLPSSHRL